jgi:hypothetical protein
MGHLMLKGGAKETGEVTGGSRKLQHEYQILNGISNTHCRNGK